MSVLNQKSLAFIGKASEKTRDVRELSVMFEDPKGFAKEHGMEISSDVVTELTRVGEIRASKSFSPDDRVNVELISFFNDVIIDGRYIKEWFYDPKTVAKKIGLKIKKRVYDRFNEINIVELVNIDECFSLIVPIVIGIIIHVIIVIVETLLAPPAYLTYTIQPLVVDQSNCKKI